MKLIITAPRGKMASLIAADAARRDDVEIVAGIGPEGRDYIGRDIGEVAMTGSVVGAPVVDDLESVIDQADVVCDFSTVGVDLVSDAVYGRPQGRHPREEGKVTFHAIRGGDTPSSHTVFFFGEGERLEITHHCLNWKGCAKGAVNACRWMASQPAGLYGIRESMGL